MNKSAVITGATSGMGAAYARKFASQGYDLVLTGRRRDIIESVAEDIRKKFNVSVKVIIAEFSEDGDIQKVVDAIQSTENLEVLINAAGYGGEPTMFSEKDLAAHELMMKSLMTAPVRFVYAALPKMMKSGHGTIINVASIGGHMPNKKFSVYCGSKAFLVLFSKSLYADLKDKGIKILVVSPGATDTDWFRDFSSEQKQHAFKMMKPMSAEAVVEASFSDLRANRPECIPGGSNKAIMAADKLLGRRLWLWYNNRI